MEINRENYEIFFLDYYEGAISDDAKLQLIAFLNLNPDLKEEFYNYENISLFGNTTNVSYEFKQSLKQYDPKENVFITDANCHEFFIADAENDLTAIQRQQLEIFLNQNPQFLDDYLLFKQIKLKADNQIVFNNKSKLKKFILLGNSSIKKIIYQSASIAASLLLLVAITSYFYNQNKQIKKPLTEIASAEVVKDIFNNRLEITSKVNDNSIPEKVNISKINNIDATESVKSDKYQNEDIDKKVFAMQSKEINQIVDKKLIHNLTLVEENRKYYTSVLDLLAYSDNVKTEPNTSDNTDKSSIFDSDLIKNQPIAEAGIFLKNAAVVGLSKIESFGANVKDTYLAVEKRLERK